MFLIVCCSKFLFFLYFIYRNPVSSSDNNRTMDSHTIRTLDSSGTGENHYSKINDSGKCVGNTMCFCVPPPFLFFPPSFSFPFHVSILKWFRVFSLCLVEWSSIGDELAFCCDVVFADFYPLPPPHQ